MKLSVAIAEFSDLLDVAASALQSIIRNELAVPQDVQAQIEEVAQIASRLREIGKQIRKCL